MGKLLLTFALILLSTPCFSATSITRHGITWTFDADYQTGQFINGDYYVIDEGQGVKINSISPGVVVEGGRTKNGSMINPAFIRKHGYDSLDIYYYDAAVNVGIGVTPATPLILSGGQSLISTISNDVAMDDNNTSFVQYDSILTCLSTAPAPNSFRPGYGAGAKTLHNSSSIHTELLQQKTAPFEKPSLATYAANFQMPWLDHHDVTWLSRFMHASGSGMNNYYFVETFAEATLLLNLDYSLAEKQSLLINFIQLGIDLHSLVESGGLGWPADGGNSNGRKWPILFAGIMLDYTPMKNIGQKSGDYLYSGEYGPGNPPPDYVSFGEDGQTHYVLSADVAITSQTTWIEDDWSARPGWTGELRWNGTELVLENMTSGTLGPWAPDTRNSVEETGVCRCRPYTSAMIGMPEWGIRHDIAPGEGDSSWTANYREIRSGARAWAGFALSAMIMGEKKAWNHDVFFDYTDRYMAIANGDPDPFGFTVPGEAAGNRGTQNNIISAMWDTYRRDYPYPPYARRLSLAGRPIKLAEPGP